MRVLYLYFADTANPGRGPSTPRDDVRPVYDDGPLIPIQPGAFSRWKANRDRVVAENAAALRSPGSIAPLRPARGGQATG